MINVSVIALMVVHAVFFGIWFMAQQALYSRGVSGSAVLMLSGMAALVLVGISLARGRKFPPKDSWKWFALAIFLNLILAELLIRVTQAYGASLGANAMGLAPVAAIFVGWLILREVPGRVGIMGIIVVMVGIYLLHIEVGAGNNLWSALFGIPLPWIFLALGIAISAGIALVVIKPAIQMTDSFMAPGVVLFVSFGVYGLVRAFFNNELGMMIDLVQPSVWGLMVALLAGFGISNWAAAQTYRYTFAASVGALKRLSAPLTVLMSLVVFGAQENMLALLIGSLVIFAGAMLIGLDKKSVVNASVKLT